MILAFHIVDAKKLAKHGMNICIVHRKSRSQLDQIEKDFKEITLHSVAFISYNMDAFQPEKRTELIENLKKYNVSSITRMASSYKFCVIANGEYDIYAAQERANEWDYAAGHAVAINAGAKITTLEGKPFLYGKDDYKNPSLLILRSLNLND